ncbi:hypothetical protein LY78DRAFT_44250 [Colletotrichum sublineola]|nr:hypothetical protein LY78DRAFT_44250 [Colletotrichum sublineola]
MEPSRSHRLFPSILPSFLPSFLPPPRLFFFSFFFSFYPFPFESLKDMRRRCSSTMGKVSSVQVLMVAKLHTILARRLMSLQIRPPTAQCLCLKWRRPGALFRQCVPFVVLAEAAR